MLNKILKLGISKREAEELLSINSARRELAKKKDLLHSQLIENDRVSIPHWMCNN